MFLVKNQVFFPSPILIIAVVFRFRIISFGGDDGGIL